MLLTHPVRVRVASVTIAALIASPIAPLIASQAPSTAKPAAAAPVPADGADGPWPHAYTTTSGAALVVYQPQVSSWMEQKHIVAYAAVSHLPKGAKAASLGTLRFESETSVALDERLVSFSELKITETNFPTLPREQVGAVVKEITTAVSLDERVIALDRVLANMDTSQVIPRNVEGVKADPPAIFFSRIGASSIEQPPRLMPVSTSRCSEIVTP